MRAAFVFALLMVQFACSQPADAPVEDAAPAAATAASAATQVSGRAPAGALVTLEPIEGAAMPEGEAVMDQYAKRFVPELLFVRVGQPVIFKNSEDQPHNVTVLRLPTGSEVFNISQNQGDAYSHTFDRAGMYDVNCDIHPGMRATLVAVSTPYAMFVDQSGRFSFRDVPPGPYKLRVSANGAEREQAVDVAGQVDVGEVMRAR